MLDRALNAAFLPLTESFPPLLHHWQVYDSGIGISPEGQRKLFNRFSQVVRVREVNFSHTKGWVGHTSPTSFHHLDAEAVRKDF